MHLSSQLSQRPPYKNSMAQTDHNSKSPLLTKTIRPYLISRTLNYPYTMQLKIIVQIIDPLPSQNVGKMLIENKKRKKNGGWNGKKKEGIQRKLQEDQCKNRKRDEKNGNGEREENKEISPNLAYITIYTQKMVYEGTLTIYEVNQQLSWTTQSIAILEQVLMGKRDKVEVQFYPIVGVENQKPMKELKKDEPTYKKQQSRGIQSNKYGQVIKKGVKNGYAQKQQTFSQTYYLQMLCQIKSGINLQLFKLQTFHCLSRHHFANQSQILNHMSLKFQKIDLSFQQSQKSYHQTQLSYKQRFNQIQVLKKQIKDSSQIQINVMKGNFIKIINNCKLEIRKHLGRGSIGVIDPKNGMVDVERMKKLAREEDGEKYQRKIELEGQRQVVESKKNLLKNNKKQAKKKSNYSQQQSSYQQKNHRGKQSQVMARQIKKVNKQSMLKRSDPKIQVQQQYQNSSSNYYNRGQDYHHNQYSQKIYQKSQQHQQSEYQDFKRIQRPQKLSKTIKQKIANKKYINYNNYDNSSDNQKQSSQQNDQFDDFNYNNYQGRNNLNNYYGGQKTFLQIELQKNQQKQREKRQNNQQNNNRQSDKDVGWNDLFQDGNNK